MSTKNEGAAGRGVLSVPCCKSLAAVGAQPMLGSCLGNKGTGEEGERERATTSI